MEIWQRRDILADYADAIKFDNLSRLRDQARAGIERQFWAPLHRTFAALPYGSELRQRGCELKVVLDQPEICIGEADDLRESEQRALNEAIRLLIPWRKGPYRLFGTAIDAEWRSDRKWARISPALAEIAGKRVADVGCSNGYYMLRSLALKPECVIGFDPSEQFYLSFELLQRFVQSPNLQYERLRAEHLSLFPGFFDAVLCMGIIYHQRDPLGLLRSCWSALKPGGLLILESASIPGEQPQALFIADRYAKAHNVYFLPTRDCLAAWLRKSAFESIRLLDEARTTSEEQRRTSLAPDESLSDFLDPADSGRTVEGYPAPQRVAFSARKRG